MTPLIRRAAVDDVEMLVQLRLALQHESEHIESDAQIETVRQAIYKYMLEKMPTEEFIVWVAEIEDKIVATSGLIFFAKPPSEKNLSGREAYVLNMYTVPQWRGKGLATMLLQELTYYVKKTDARRIWLYATADGKPIYEKAGFVAKERHTLEMELFW